jgi:hypothetical protein
MNDPVSRHLREPGALHAGCLALADWCVDRRTRLLLAAIPALTLAAAGLGRGVLQDFPSSGDEYVYLYQAATLAAGRLWNPTPPAPELFGFNYIASENGRTYGSFPPGWPLLLALATETRIPLWLVNPLLGSVTIVLVFLLGQALYGARVGMIAAALTATSPFFLFNAASYFSHTFCGFLLLLAAYLATRQAGDHPIVPVSVGVLLGWAVTTRYFTGVVGAIPVLWLLVHGRPHRLRTLAMCVLGGLPWVAMLLAYNTALSGSPWRLTTRAVTFSNWFAPGFALRGTDILATQLLRFMLWTPPLLLPIYLVYLRRAPVETRRGPLDWMFVMLAVSLYFYVNRGGNQYGPRFYYEAFPFLVLFTTAGLFRRPSWLDMDKVDRRLFVLLAASVATAPLSFGAHAAIEGRVTRERSDPFSLAAQAKLRNAVVLLNGRVGTLRSMDAADLARNGISYSGSVLYGVDQGDPTNCRYRTQLGDRALYRYTWDPAAGQGVLTPVLCDGTASGPEGR